MKFRSQLLGVAPATTAFALVGLLGSAQSLAQSAYLALSRGLDVIDTATNAVTATIQVGPCISCGVVVTPDGSTVYVANSDDNTVSVIKTTSNTVTATIPVGSSPVGVAVTPD